jgi:cysteine desulfurase
MLYADYNGSAPVSNCVKELLMKKLDQCEYANPNAAHSIGQNLYMEQENCRMTCAKLLGAKSSQIIFNSGSTEGISHIFNSLLLDAKENGKSSLMISSIEHPAVVNNAEYYCQLFGMELITVQTKSNGEIDLEDFKNKLNPNMAMVSIMAANNETGVIQPYCEIGKLCREANVPFLCDTTQLIGKTSFNFNESNIDYAVLSSHKVGGLIGSGLILCQDANNLRPFIIGGNQERSLRGGTQNYIGIASFACALESSIKKLEQLEELKKERINFEKTLKEKFPSLVIFGEDAPRLASTSFLSLPGTSGQKIQAKLEKHGILVTTSSACCDQKTSISRILENMNVSEEQGAGAIRISIGHSNPKEDYAKIYNALCDIYQSL